MEMKSTQRQVDDAVREADNQGRSVCLYNKFYMCTVDQGLKKIVIKFISGNTPARFVCQLCLGLANPSNL